MTLRDIFLSAVRGDDGEIDSGYLAMFIVTALVTGAIPFMCTAAGVSMLIASDHYFDAQELGIGIGSVCGGLGVALAAVGAFRRGDQPRLPPAPPATPSAIGNVAAAAAAAGASASSDALQAAARGVEPAVDTRYAKPKRKRRAR